MGDCPERARTVALGTGTLRSEDVAAARSHAESCDACRVVLSEVGTAPTMRVALDTPQRTQATMTAPDRESTPRVVERESRPWIGRYRVLEKLGAGGMGAVFAAEDRELDRKVAIKLLHGTSETASARLVREARALAKLRHPNVVTIYEVGRHEGDAFVAMELIEGTTLRDWMHGEHTIEERLAVVIQAGHGLAAAHAEGLIHRDFKPENVMVGKDGRVQVLDFGLAKTALVADDDEPRHPSDEAIDSITQTGTLLGTPAYMAPEQLVGDATDARTDQFAYCVTLFEVIHGFRPFAGSTHAALHAAIVDRRFVELPRRTGVPAHIEAAIMRGLAVDPEQRFPDTKALLAALRAREPDAAPPPPRRRGVALALIGVVAIGGGAAWWSTRDKEADTSFVVDLSATKPRAVLSEALPGDRMKVTIHRLSNGLTVWVSPNPTTPRIDARLVLRAGSRDTDVGGLAHIVEHMVSAGTSKLGTLDFEKEQVHLDKLRTLYAAHAKATGAAKEKLIAEIDAESVAASRYAIPWELTDVQAILGIQRTTRFTFWDATQFGVDMPSNKFKLWAKLEGERVAAPVFRGFHAESGVVFDEIHTRRSQGAYESMTDELYATVFVGHPYAASPSGTYADLVAEPFTAAEQFHDTWYVPNNAALLLAGAIDADEAIPALERELARWRSKPLPPREPRPLRPLAGEQRLVVKGADAPIVLIGWQGVALGHADEEATVVLGQLVTRLAEDYASRARIQAFDVRLIEAGMLGIGGFPTAGRPLDDTVAAVDELVRTVQTGAFSDDLFKAVVHNYRLTLDRAPDSNAARVERMATAVVDDRGWAHELDRSKRAAALTKQDVVRVAKQYLTRNRVVVTSEVGPYQMAAVKRPKVTPLEPRPNARSAFAAEVLATRIADIPPKFVEPRDYKLVDTALGEMSVVHNTEDDSYALRMQFPIGEREQPIVCAAIHALDHAGTGDSDAAARRARWYGRAHTVNKFCGADEIVVEITGADATFDADWADTERWLSGAGIDDAVWNHAVREYLQFRAWGNGGYVADALDQFVSYGKASKFLVPADATRLARTSAAEIRQTLQNVVGLRRTLAYYGPRGADAIKPPAGLQATRTPPPRAPRRLLRQTGTRIALLDTGPNRAVTARIRISLGPIDPRQLAIARVFSSYLNNPVLKTAFSARRGIAFHGLAQVEERATGDDSTLEIQFSTTADLIIDALEVALTSAREPNVDPTYAAQAARRNEEVFRADWLTPRELTTKLLFWKTRGLDGDPRPDMYNATIRTDAAALGKVATDLARAPTYISISGDVSKLDRTRLGKLGPVEIATPATLFVP